MLELYNFAQSTCSLKVRICLAEKRLEWLDRRLVSRNNDHLKPEYLKLNPSGVVPTLVHDGIPIIESSVILQYLDEAFPEVPLTPDDIVEKARMRAWLCFFDHVPTPAVRYPSFNLGGLIRKFQELSPDEFETACNRRPLKADFYRRMGQDGFSDREIQKALDDIRITVDRMEGALAQSGPWLLGLLEAETGHRANFLDHVDFLLAVRRQHDVELGLLLGRIFAGRWRRRHRDRRRGRYAPFLFEQFRQIRRLEDGQRRQIFGNFFQISHFSFLLGLNSVPGFR